MNQIELRKNRQVCLIYFSTNVSKKLSTVLTHAEMMLETERIKASSAHGTQKALAKNKNKELRMSLKRDSEHWDRWIKNYHKEDDIFQLEKI